MRKPLVLAAALAFLLVSGAVVIIARAGRRSPSGDPAPPPQETPAPALSHPVEPRPDPPPAARDPGAGTQTVTEPPLPAAAPQEISGRALAGESSAPLSGALVRIAAERGPLQADEDAWSAEMSADAQGRFAFSGLAFAPHRLRVSTAGRLAAESTGVFPGDAVELRLERNEDIPCQLVLDTEEGTSPLADTPVLLRRDGGDPAWSAAAESDASGLFGIAGIRRQDFEAARKLGQIEASVPGYMDATLTALPGGESYRIAVEAGTTVIGVVLDAATRKPIAGARVYSDGDHEVATDNRGQFRITGVSDDLTAFAAGHIPQTREIEEDEDGRPVQVTFELDAGVTLSGKVMDAARAPLAGFRIAVADGAWTLESQSDALPGRLSEAGASITDERGAYRLEGLAAELLGLPGELELEIRPPHAAEGFVHEVTIGASAGEVEQDIVLELQLELAGSVRDGAGAPVSRAGVFLESIDSDSLSAGGTDAAGGFVLRNLLAGSYRLRVEREGQLLHLFTVDLPRPSLDITLGPLTRLQGTVLAADTREALAGMSVQLFAAGGIRGRVVPEVSTDASGKFLLDLVPAGDYALVLQPGAEESLFTRLGHRHEEPVAVGAEGWSGSVTYPVLAAGDIKLAFQLVDRAGVASAAAGSVWVAVASFRPVAGVPVSATRGEPVLVPDSAQGFEVRWRAGDYRLRCTTTLDGRTLVKEEAVNVTAGGVVERTVSFLR